jgi:hypothetical protein
VIFLSSAGPASFGSPAFVPRVVGAFGAFAGANG